MISQLALSLLLLGEANIPLVTEKLETPYARLPLLSKQAELVPLADATPRISSQSQGCQETPPSASQLPPSSSQDTHCSGNLSELS